MPDETAPRRPLLMIPGPVEVSERVLRAAAGPPPGHLAPDLIADFGAALGDMRRAWLAGADAAPFAVPGGGTLAMESAVTNLVDPGERAVLVDTGHFGRRMGEMLRRRGAEVVVVEAPPGEAPAPEEVAEALDRAASGGEVAALFATHVDTSTGVRLDPRPLAALAAERGVLSVFDGVCATAGERFAMEAWGADVYLTASQKALGLPAGLALWVASPRAMEARERLSTPPPLTLDWHAWRPVMEAYEAGRGAYFSTPPTTLIRALAAGLAELLAAADDPGEAMEAAFARHERAAHALRAAWAALGLGLVPVRPELAANTLSALRCAPGRAGEIVQAAARRGVAIAGGLHPDLADRSFRVGHMGVVTTRPEALRKTVEAVAAAVCDEESEQARVAVAAFESAWG